MKWLALAFLLLTACWDSQEVRPTGGFTMKIRQGTPPDFKQATLKATYGRSGVAEVFDSNGRSCGSGRTELGRYTVGPVSWGADSASVGGIEGRWDLSRCFFVPTGY